MKLSFIYQCYILYKILKFFILTSQEPSSAAWSSASLYYGSDHNPIHPDDSTLLGDDERGWGMASPPCCGSVVPFAHTRQSPPFTRFVTGPTVEVWDARNSDVDAVAPGR